MPRADVQVAQTAGLAQFNGGGTQYVIATVADPAVLYVVFVDSGSDVAFVKSIDGGLTWSAPVIVFAGTVTALSVWYDRWSDIAAGLIHVAYQESATDDTLYRTIDTESSDALSTQTVIFAGASTAAGGFLSITRARGGNVYCRTQIDAGTEGGFYRLPNANVPNGAWDAARTINEAAATQDMIILAPGFAADNQDIMAVFWDVSANQISLQTYDDSANTWGETIATGTFTEQVAATSFPHFALAVDLTNSYLVVVAWNAIDAANQDLTCWTLDESGWTAQTDVVANATDDCGLCGVGIDLQTGDWYVAFAGNPDGSETWLTSVNIYYKVSRDQGTTWSAAQRLTTTARDITWLVVPPRFSGAADFIVAFHEDVTLDVLRANVALPPMPAQPFTNGLQVLA